MNNTLHIIQHSGLGDHILCNGIIRTYAQRYDKVFINTVPSTDANVRFMYRDLKNVEFYDLFYVDYQKYISDNPQNNYLLIGVTGQFFGKLERGEYRSFDYGFYACAGVPYYHRWGRFHVERDEKKEKEAFYDRIGLRDGEDYIFIHEDPSRGRLLNPDYITKDYRAVRVNDYKDVGVFDFLRVIEKAKEIHVMDSCFLALIDNIQVSKSVMLIHNYGCNSVVFPTAVKMRWNLLIDKTVQPNEMYCNDNDLSAL